MSLYDSVASRIDPAAGLIESTSGNLGVALAAICRAEGVPFTAVTDRLAARSVVAAMRRHGARVITATDPDTDCSYLNDRLRIVREYLTADPRLTWTNQYENQANPLSHELSTGPELRAQVEGTAVVLVPVSTGGTLAGVSAFARRHAEWTVIGVDVHGSHAFRYAPGRRLLPGIGASRASAFLPGAGPAAGAGGGVELVTAEQAVAACLWLAEHARIGIGGSSGAAVAAALSLVGDGRADDIVCLCPDGAANYLDTIYSASWRASQGMRAMEPAALIEAVDWDFPVPEPREAR